MKGSIIYLILLTSWIHICQSSQSPQWIGSYIIDSSCDQENCCCPTGQAIITSLSSNQLLVSASVAGAPCRDQLNGSTTVAVPLPVPADKNGYQITTEFLGSLSRFTLDSESKYIANVNLNSPQCSGAAHKIENNWIGTYKIDDSCNQNECCCLSDQVKITKKDDTHLLVSAPVAGTPCKDQLSGATSISESMPIPKDKNGFQITTDFLGTRNRFTLTYDNQFIAHANLDRPKCSGMSKRIEEAQKSTASLITSTSILILINAILFRTICV